MRRRVLIAQNSTGISLRVSGFIIGIILIISASLIYKSYHDARIINSPYRFNIVTSHDTGGVAFLSFDPQEHQVFVLEYPDNLEIRSRSVGTYRMDSLYTLGTYDGSSGTFLRRKIQGFMRVPIEGFLYINDSQLPIRQSVVWSLITSAFGIPKDRSFNRLDSLVLLMRSWRYEWRLVGTDELQRAGALNLVNNVYTYNHERLKQYLESRIFDWAVGAHEATVAIVNASDEVGLGRDVAEFMTNIGFDIVSVKSNDEMREKTSVTYQTPKEEEVLTLLSRLFGWSYVEEGDTSSYRAQYVIFLGRDALDLF